jgi:hypothetical protein
MYPSTLEHPAMAQDQDERIAKRAVASDSRADRALSDRPVTESREATDPLRNEELFAMLRDVNTKLPTPPAIPGFHLCWLTTTNQSDPIEHRLRMGYQLVKQSELPGFSLPTQQSSQVSDEHIRINEMVLSKISMERFELIMKYLHHDLPLEQIQTLKNSVRIERDGKGREVGYTGDGFSNGVSDGFTTLGRARAPSFAGVA